MAWIAKKSGSMRVERRDEPFLTEAMRRELRERVLPRYERAQGAVLPALHMIQHAYGHIPAQALEEIAAQIGITRAEVLDAASFYEEYWLNPRGRHLIAVCRSIACECCGHGAITDAVRRKLGIEVGETTDDGRFTLVEVECLGSCDTAPVALIDENLHENLTPDSIGTAIDAHAEASHHANGHHSGHH